MSIKTLLRSFGGGEIAPELAARLDLAKNQTGLAACRNFWVLPQGPVQNRPGSEYVNEVKFSGRKTFLMEFTFNDEQTFIIEAGHGYLRFHSQGGTLCEDPVEIEPHFAGNPAVFRREAHGYADGDWLRAGDFTGDLASINGRWFKVIAATADTFSLATLAGAPLSAAGLTMSAGKLARPVEKSTPYDEQDLFELHYVQSADVVTIVHRNHPVHELRRLGDTEWDFVPAVFAPGVTPPSGLAIARTPAGGSAPQKKYTVVTRYENADEPGDYLHSHPALPWSAPLGALMGSSATACNDLSSAGAKNILTWTPASPRTPIRNAFNQTFAFKDYVVLRENSGWKVIGSPTTDPTFEDANLPEASAFTGPTVPAHQTPVPRPGALAVTAVEGSTPKPQSNTYAVTALDEAGRESVVSESISIYNDLTVANAYNRVSWSAVANASRYNVYKQVAGIFGYVGQTPGLAFVDDNIVPDLGLTPPLYRDPFAAPGNYPGAVGYYEQRKVFGGTASQPQNVWMTRSATESDLSYHQPSLDDDSIAFKIASNEVSSVRHVVPLGALALLTSGAEFRVSPQGGDALTPASLSVRPDGYEGASPVQPLSTGSALLFAAARGGRLRELRYAWQSQGYDSRDISVLAPQLFDGHQLADLAYAKAPDKRVWAVRSDGALLGLTWLPEQEVLAWHRHDTAGGAFESVAVVAEGVEDSLYCVVRRSIGGRSVRCIERLRSRRFATPADAYFVDCGLSYGGAPASRISGLHHLEGCSVSVLADGAVHPPRTVEDGGITLEHPASTVHAGLPIVADIQTLPLAFEAQALGQGRAKNLSKVHLRLQQSSNVYAGPDFGQLTLLKQRSTEPYGSPPALLSGEYPLALKGAWNADGSLCLRNTDPLPVTLLGITLEVAVGD